MRRLVLVVLTFLASSTCFAQVSRNYGSTGGFGNVLYPGTGHAPANPPGTLNSGGFAHRLGQNIIGNPQPGRPYRAGSNRTLIVPYPVYYGPIYGADQGGGPGSGQYSEGQPPIVNTNTAPSVVINQTFVPERAAPMMREYSQNGQDSSNGQSQDGMSVYEGPRSVPMQDPAGVRRDGLPTLYLIAFKDNSIVPALGYWVEAGNLHYVSTGHTLNQVSLDLVDRELSQRLNDERGIEFKLPR